MVYYIWDNSYYEILNGKELCIDNQIPFDIPSNWAWARLGSICNFGECQNAEDKDIPINSWILDLEHIEKETGILLSKKRKDNLKIKSTKHKFEVNDVLYSKLCPYLNKVIIADESGYCTSEILPLKFDVNIISKYTQIYLISLLFVNYAISCSYGVKMPRLGTKDGKLALVPIPPIE